MVLLRINAAMVFLSLCLGEVLVLYVASQANDLLTMLNPNASKLSTVSVQLFLLYAPAVLTASVTLMSVRGKFKTLLNIAPALATSLLAVLLGGPLLSAGVRHAAHSHAMWLYISDAQAFIVAAGALLSLAFLWSQRGSFKPHEKRHR